MDWDFLHPNSEYKLLRNNLSYKNPKFYCKNSFFMKINIFYYLDSIMCTNLILRCAWVFSVSPDLVQKLSV
jgi:hypothetical protein